MDADTLIQNAVLFRRRRRRRRLLAFFFVFIYAGTRVPRTRSLGGSLWAQLFSRLPDAEFMGTFRVNWALFGHVSAALREQLTPVRASRQAPVDAEEMVAMFLYRLAHGTSYSQMAHFFDRTGSTVHKSVTRVRVAFLRHFAGEVAPPPRAAVDRVAADFLHTTDFRLGQCVGAMDGTNIYCRAPSIEEQQAYYNHKSGMSINAHLIVDSG